MYNDFWSMFERSGWIDAYLLYRGFYPRGDEFDTEFSTEFYPFTGNADSKNDRDKLSD